MGRGAGVVVGPCHAGLLGHLKDLGVTGSAGHSEGFKWWIAWREICLFRSL